MNSSNFFEGLLYIKDIEFSHNYFVQHCIKSEYNSISLIKNKKEKSIIDIGAGYGRLIPFLSPQFKVIQAVELEQNMFQYLDIRCKQFTNCKALLGDVFKMENWLKETKRIFLLAQNTIGTLSEDDRSFRELIGNEAMPDDELFVTFFKAEYLEDVGLDIYKTLSNWVGKPDLQRSVFEKGIFKSETNYSSKWYTENEIDSFVERLQPKQILTDSSESFFRIVHLKL